MISYLSLRKIVFSCGTSHFVASPLERIQHSAVATMMGVGRIFSRGGQ